MPNPTEGPKGSPQPSPQGQPASGATPTPFPTPSESGSILNSPFAKMFAKVGVFPTAKQMIQIMGNILKQQIDQIRKSEQSWKEAMRKMKDAIEGDD